MGCFYLGASLGRLRVPSVFVVRAGFDVDASHIFPQCCTLYLIRSVAGVGRAKACTDEVDFLSAQWQGWRSVPK